MAFRRFRRVESTSVVSDLDDHEPGSLFDENGRRRCLSVLGDIRQRLTRDPEELRLDTWVEMRTNPRPFDGDADSRPAR